MSESDSTTYTIDGALEQISSRDRLKKHLSVDVDSFRNEDMKALLEGVSQIESENLTLFLSPDEESDFDELLGYVGYVLLQQNCGFSEYAICPMKGLSEEDRGSPYSKIILNRVPEDYGMSLTVSDEKLYQL